MSDSLDNRAKRPRSGLFLQRDSPYWFLRAELHQVGSQLSPANLPATFLETGAPSARFSQQVSRAGYWERNLPRQVLHHPGHPAERHPLEGPVTTLLCQRSWCCGNCRRDLFIVTPPRCHTPAPIRPHWLLGGRDVNLRRPLRPPALASDYRARLGRVLDPALHQSALVSDKPVPSLHTLTVVIVYPNSPFSRTRPTGFPWLVNLNFHGFPWLAGQNSSRHLNTSCLCHLLSSSPH